MGAYQDLNADQGADFSTSLNMNNSDGTPINVATYLFAGQIKTSYFVPNVAANLVITKTDAPNGNITISLDAANTSNLPAGQYVYDVTTMNNSNVKSRLIQGLFLLSPGVTGIVPPTGLPYVV